jgi:glycosyltransferase involved in cell wall biosynthesis
MRLAAHRWLASQLGLAERAVLTGRVENAYAYLRHADVFALPSREERSGSVSLREAMQAGVAIVASAIDGIPEDVSREDSALLVEPGNVGQLSGALARVLTDVEMRRRLGRRARGCFVEEGSVEAFTRALGDVYAQLGFENGRS